MILPHIPTRHELATRASAVLDRMDAGCFARRGVTQWHKLLTSDCPLTPCTMTAARQNVEWAEDAMKRTSQ